MAHNSTLKIKNSKSHNPLLWGTIGYLFLFIFRPFEYWEWLGAYHIERIYMIGLIFVVTFWSGKRYKHHPIATALLVFFGVICFSVIIAYRPDKALDQVWEYFKLMALFFVILLTVRNERDFRILVIAFLGITGIYVGKSLWEFLFHGRHVYRMGFRRLVGIDKTFSDPNTFAATILYSLPFAVALWKTSVSNRLKLGLVFYGVMSITAIGLTGSRAGMVSFIFFLFLLWVRGKMKIIGALGIIVVLAVAWYSLPGEYQMRFETIYDDSINPAATASGQGRLEGLKNGIKLFELSPLWGWGAGNFPYASEMVGATNQMQCHNLYGQLLADLGILGAISFLWLCYLIFKTQRNILNLKSKQPKNSLFIQMSIASFNTLLLLLFQGNFGHNLYRYTWVLISAMLIISHRFAMRDLAPKGA